MSKSVCDLMRAWLHFFLLTNNISLSLFHAKVIRGKNGFGYPDLFPSCFFCSVQKVGAVITEQNALEK